MTPRRGEPRPGFVLRSIPLRVPGDAPAGKPPVARGDGDVDFDFDDLNLLLAAYGMTQPDPGFDAGADLDGSGTVGVDDLNILRGNYGVGVH